MYVSWHERFEMWLECSLYISPRVPGLTEAELVEVGTVLGFGRGEVLDGIGDLRRSRLLEPLAADRLMTHLFTASTLSNTWDGDPRDVHAFRAVLELLDGIRREHGRDHWSSIEAIVAGAEASGQRVEAVEVALAIGRFNHWIEHKDGRVRLTLELGALSVGSYLEHVLQQGRFEPLPRPDFLVVLQAVEAVIRKRTEGEDPIGRDPIRFLDGVFRCIHGPQTVAWWRHLRGEFQIADPGAAPLTTSIMSGALVEGILALSATQARSTGLTMQKLRTDQNPRQWQASDLIHWASLGDDPLLSAAGKRDAERAVDLRHCIHGGRFLARDTDAYYLVSVDRAHQAVVSASSVAADVASWFVRNPVAEAKP